MHRHWLHWVHAHRMHMRPIFVAAHGSGGATVVAPQLRATIAVLPPQQQAEARPVVATNQRAAPTHHLTTNSVAPILPAPLARESRRDGTARRGGRGIPRRPPSSAGVSAGSDPIRPARFGGGLALGPGWPFPLWICLLQGRGGGWASLPPRKAAAGAGAGAAGTEALCLCGAACLRTIWWGLKACRRCCHF